jgi:hypothetical protein
MKRAYSIGFLALLLLGVLARALPAEAKTTVYITTQGQKIDLPQERGASFDGVIAPRHALPSWMHQKNYCPIGMAENSRGFCVVTRQRGGYADRLRT